MATRIQFDLPAISDPEFRGFSRAVPCSGLLAWLRSAAARWRQRRVLQQFDDRMLRDIGISRSEALAETRKPFWRT